jgi:hypothetical protein
VVAGIQYISRIGTNVTVETTIPHEAVVGSQIVIAGTVNFNSGTYGVYTITAVESDTVFNFTMGAFGNVSEVAPVGGTSTTVLNTTVSLLTMDPSYQFKYSHAQGALVTYLDSNSPYVPQINGSDYTAYVTGTADARIYCQSLIEAVTALGINLEIVIIYPNDEGLGNAGDQEDLTKPGPYSDAATYVWASSEVTG